jgi:hypothetical protein
MEKVYNCYASATAVGLSLNLLDYTREFKESVKLCISSSMTVNNSNDGFGNIIPSTLFTS